MPTTRLYVVRHGQTEWNAVGRLQGHSNSPLSAAGQEQVQQLAARFKSWPVAAIYSSDLGRAQESAAPIAEVCRCPVSIDARLRERCLGIFEGLTRLQASEQHPELYARHRSDDPEFTIPTGQSVHTYADQINGAVAEIAARHSGSSVVVVTHGGALGVLFRACARMALNVPRCFSLPNAALNILDWSDGAFKLRCWGDTSHLEHMTDLAE
jgi:probable phosphoglycerate mutase